MDIFVCTADPAIEPPVMVINTVLSVMAYDYPPENLSIYLSDDAGSEITFYALLEASRFSKYWLPYCKKFKIEPRSPATYFESLTDVEIFDANHAKEFASIEVMVFSFCHPTSLSMYSLSRVLPYIYLLKFCRNCTKKWKTELKLQTNLVGLLTRHNTEDLQSGILLYLEEITTPFYK